MRVLAVAPVAVLLAGVIAGTAFARDERRAERVVGDDDPVVLPSWFLPDSVHGLRDPETTGSVRKSSEPRECRRIAWFPDRAAEEQFQRAC